MKKVFLLILFIVLIFSTSFQKNYALESESPSPTPSPVPSPTSVDYPLPYPGILPDNPLYIIKVFRDRVVSTFISDNFKKAEFDLLISDVRLNAATYLFQKGSIKYSLAETTVSKAENYFEESIQAATGAKQEGIDVNDITSKLITASQKHVEVISQLEIKATGDVKDRLAIDLERAKTLEKRAIDLKAK